MDNILRKKDTNIGQEKIGISILIFVLYNIYYISGNNGPAHNYIIIALFMLWNVIAILENSTAYFNAIMNKTIGFLALFLLFYFISSIFVAEFIYTMEYIMVFLTFYGVVIQYNYYYYRNNIRDIQLGVASIFLSFIIFAIKAILFYIDNPSAARILAGNYYAFDMLAIGGGYAIAFGSAILIAFLFEMLINYKYKGSKLQVPVIIAIIILFYLLIQTESTITILSAVIGMVFAIIRKLFNGKKQTRNLVRRVLASLLIIVIAIVVLFNINNIGRQIMHMTSNSMDNVLSRRVYRIAEKMYYLGTDIDSENYVNVRWNTVKESWETFVANPLLGIGYKCGNIFSSLQNNGVGTHSEFADMLAQHGIIGSFGFFAFLISALNRQSKKCNCRAFLLTLIMMMLLNPFRYFHGYIVIFFLIPMLDHLNYNKATLDVLEGSYGKY